MSISLKYFTSSGPNPKPVSQLYCEAPPWPWEVLMPRAPWKLEPMRPGAIPEKCQKPSAPYWANRSTRSSSIDADLHQRSQQNKMSPASEEAGLGQKPILILFFFFGCYLTHTPKKKSEGVFRLNSLSGSLWQTPFTHSFFWKKGGKVARWLTC